MIVLDPGHYYELSSLDGDSAIQRLQFVKRVGKKYPGNIDAHPGTTSQEILRCAIDRSIYVNAQIPCWQTRVGIWLIGLTIWLFEYRAARLHKRKSPGIFDSVWGKTCYLCGHVGCTGGCR